MSERSEIRFLEAAHFRVPPFGHELAMIRVGRVGIEVGLVAEAHQEAVLVVVLGAALAAGLEVDDTGYGGKDTTAIVDKLFGFGRSYRMLEVEDDGVEYFTCLQDTGGSRGGRASGEGGSGGGGYGGRTGGAEELSSFHTVLYYRLIS